MRRAGLFLCLLGLLTAISFLQAADQDFYIKDHDRIVFYGDSITDQRLYTTFTETYIVTRYPKLHATFMRALDKLEEELVKQRESAVQPKAHQFELVPTA